MTPPRHWRSYGTDPLPTAAEALLLEEVSNTAGRRAAGAVGQRQAVNSLCQREGIPRHARSKVLPPTRFRRAS